MGTTLTALNTGNTAVVYVAMIEGCPYILTSGSPGEAFNAWQSSSFAGGFTQPHACAAASRLNDSARTSASAAHTSFQTDERWM